MRHFVKQDLVLARARHDGLMLMVSHAAGHPLARRKADRRGGSAALRVAL